MVGCDEETQKAIIIGMELTDEERSWMNIHADLLTSNFSDTFAAFPSYGKRFKQAVLGVISNSRDPITIVFLIFGAAVAIFATWLVIDVCVSLKDGFTCNAELVIDSMRKFFPQMCLVAGVFAAGSTWFAI